MKTPPDHSGLNRGLISEKYTEFSPELQQIIDRWTALPGHIRQAILALLKASPEK